MRKAFFSIFWSAWFRSPRLFCGFSLAPRIFNFITCVLHAPRVFSFETFERVIVWKWTKNQFGTTKTHFCCFCEREIPFQFEFSSPLSLAADHRESWIRLWMKFRSTRFTSCGKWKKWKINQIWSWITFWLYIFEFSRALKPSGHLIETFIGEWDTQIHLRPTNTDRDSSSSSILRRRPTSARRLSRTKCRIISQKKKKNYCQKRYRRGSSHRLFYLQSVCFRFFFISATLYKV